MAVPVLRYLLPPLTLVAFVTALVGTIPKVPLFTGDLSKYGQLGGTMKIGFATTSWENFSLTGFEAVAGPDVRINYMYCSSFKTVFRVIMAMALGAIVLSLFAFLISLLQSFCKRKTKLVLLLYIGLALVCEVVVVAVALSSLSRSFCADDLQDSKSNRYNTTMINLEKQGFTMGTGIILHIVSLVALALAFIITPFTQTAMC